MSQHQKGISHNKKGLTVNVRQGNNEIENKNNLEHALKQLKRRLLQEGMNRELRATEFHETKGQVCRRKNKEAIRRHSKNMAKKQKYQ